MRYRRMYPAALCFAAFLAAIGLILDDPSNILPGLWKIMITEDALITDYMEIAGVGAAFVNSALVTPPPVCAGPARRGRIRQNEKYPRGRRELPQKRDFFMIVRYLKWG